MSRSTSKFAVILLTAFSIVLAAAASAFALTFEPAPGSYYSTNKLTANALLPGDLNNDGRDDLVVGGGDYATTVYLSGPDGALTQAVGSPISSPAYIFEGALADFDNDDNLDVALSHNSSVTVLFGAGDGTFPENMSIATTVNGQDIEAGDFNNDGNADLAVVGWSTNMVAVYLGTGLGTFSAPVTFSVGAGPESITVTDFNKDGFEDFATANLDISFGVQPMPGAVSVMLGDGTGNFTNATGSPFNGYFQPYSISHGDYNGDGNLDIAAVGRTTRNMTLLYGDGTGSFTNAVTAPEIDSLWGQGVATADFDDDGYDDVVIGRSSQLSDPTGSSAPIFLGSATGVMTESPDGPWDFPSPSYPWNMATGDFNGDGKPDFVSGDQGGRINVFLQGSDPVQPDPCPTARQSFSRVANFKGSKPKGRKQRPGVRFVLSVGGTFAVDLKTTLIYKSKKGKRTVRLRNREFTIDGEKRVRIPLPGKVKRQIRKKYGTVRGVPVTVRLGGSMISADRPDCATPIKPAKLKTKTVVIGMP